MSYKSADEYNTKVKNNYKRFVLLTSRNIHWRQEYILETIYGLNGYKCHKTVKYEKNSSHIHVQFEEEYMAKEAVDFLINLSPDLTVGLVDDMLRDWFYFERNCGFIPPWTITVVDIIGNPPFGLNFLTEAILHSVFRDFCNPYVLPYTAALNEPHVQVIFGSMTEALAACISFGEWCVRDRKMDSFFFRVRIYPSEKEGMLISNSGGIPQEAFKLDYFVSLGNKSVPKSNEQCTKRNLSRHYQNKRLKKNVTIDPNQNTLSLLVNDRNPFVFVPIIAPFNDYAQALMVSNQLMKAGETSVPNLQRNQNIQGTEDEIGGCSSTQSGNTVDCPRSDQGVNNEVLNKNDVPSKLPCSDFILNSVKNIQEKPDLIPAIIRPRHRRICKKAHLKVKAIVWLKGIEMGIRGEPFDA